MHDDKVIHVNERNQMFGITDDDIIMRINIFRQAADNIIVFAGAHLIAQSRPAADIVPVEGTFRDDNIFNFLHDRVIY